LTGTPTARQPAAVPLRRDAAPLRAPPAAALQAPEAAQGLPLREPRAAQELPLAEPWGMRY